MAVRIMVPLDGSGLSETAIPFACDLASFTGGIVRLVRVHTSGEADRAQQDAEREYLAEFARDLEYGRFIDAVHLLGGNPAPSLNDYINNEEIDVVVMATHGRAGMSRAISGSVADELVRIAQVPIVMLRPDDESFDYPIRHHFSHIIIPVDGTKSSETMVDVAIALFGTAPRFTLVEVMSPPEHLREFVDSLRARGINIDYVVLEGLNVADAVREYAARENADLIAMITSGRAGWKRWLMGSVGAELIHKAPVPLMLLRNRKLDPASLVEAE